MSKKYIYRKTICRVVSMFLLMLNSSYVVVPDAEAMIDMRNEGKITLKLEELLDIETENPKINLGLVTK